MRYLTKSRFKLALECPTKLFYTKKPDIYADCSMDDPFLQALAEGGFQVGELAKCYYPEGIEIKGLGYEATWGETSKYLKNESVTLFEPAIKYNNLFVRVDILKKHKKLIELIEVKSKSFNSSTFLDEIWQKRNKNKLDSGWMPYLYDIAFQSYVTKLTFPEYEIKSFLMCSDKDKLSSVDGLNQKFFISKEDEQVKVIRKGDTSISALGKEILTKVDVTDVVFKILNDVEDTEIFKDYSFSQAVEYFAKHFEQDIKIKAEVDKHCKGCQFREGINGKQSGFKECWKECTGMADEELNSSFAFDVWNFRSFNLEKPLIDDLDETDIKIKERDDVREGLSNSERQWLQIRKYKDRDDSEYIDKEGIKSEFKKHIYPLHFIDFETCMVAIPFNKNRKPYEQIAFQFSHHVLYEDSRYEHMGEWIEVTPGKFPNYDFVRNLKKQLEKDEGTIFKYSNHENTVLCQIRTQLLDSDELDKEELISWINTITHHDKEEKWCGSRDMVDLCDIVKRFYYHPKTQGSNSIKYVLPAILMAQGISEDPYKKLPPVFNGYDREKLDLLMSEDDIRNGGAALTAYALMQFSEMSNDERNKIKEALLRYCKLDTEAMIWIYQYLIRESI